jgi:signal peptide peptidase SppA
MKTEGKQFPHILSAVYSTPWAITEPWLKTIAGIVEDRSKASIQEFSAAVNDANGKKESKLQVTDGVAIIPVMGPIFPRANLMTRLSGATSSAEVSGLIDDALEQDVAGIIFNIDSPGGSVSGGFEVANKIAGLPIPSVAMIEGTGASLAYLWASQCDQVCVSQASIVGSVSVVMQMASDERAAKNEGIDIVTIKSGTLKQAGDPASLAFAGQYQSLLGQLDTYHQMFVSMVGTARPKMDMTKVGTGDIWIGAKAVAAGLADRVCTLNDVLMDFSQ